MARRRFYAPPDSIEAEIVTLSADETHHLMHVLRMTPGDEAFVFDGCGNEYKCSFRSLKDTYAQLEITDALCDIVESPLHLTLAHALAKGEKFDFIIQKATELGVSRIAPLVTRYADVRLDDQQRTRRVERWRRISLAALKQCGRRKLVEITAPRTLQEFFSDSDQSPPVRSSPALSSQTHRALLLFSERGGVTLTDALDGISNGSPVVALVGPEGGWSDEELALLNEFGCKSVTLGPRVLRTETAAVVAIALIQNAMGGLSTRGTE
ncbi:MAG: 16S rRNA (uracil(1498)-N(3))-methyltransferase [Acidobacteriota bacterium]